MGDVLCPVSRYQISLNGALVVELCVAAGAARACSVLGVLETACDRTDCVLLAALLPVALATAVPWVAWADGLAIWGAAVSGATNADLDCGASTTAAGASAVGTHRTRTDFTASSDRSPGCERYIRSTVTMLGAGMSRRWRLAIAVLAALSVFVALVAGSSLRPKFSAAALPEPAAWAHVTHDARAHLGQRQYIAVGRSHGEPERGLVSGAVPMHSKTFLSMWMPRAMPTNWVAVSPYSDWSALPASFDAPGGVAGLTAAIAPVSRDTATLLCIVRC